MAGNDCDIGERLGFYIAGIAIVAASLVGFETCRSCGPLLEADNQYNRCVEMQMSLYEGNPPPEQRYQILRNCENYR